MRSSLLRCDSDVKEMRRLIGRCSSASRVVDFDEHMLLEGIRTRVRIWRHDGAVVGFAYVDDYCNLWFEADPDTAPMDQLEAEIVEWGMQCMSGINQSRGEIAPLDLSCDTDDQYRLGFVGRNGFEPQEIRTLRYRCSLNGPIAEATLPKGYSIRSVRGKDEAPKLVALHRAAFGTANMTLDARLAMMSVASYRQDMDLVAIAPDGEPAAFCVCGMDNEGVGYTDPIGTHPRHRRLGLAKAVVAAGLVALREAGAPTAELGTSSENEPMQEMARQLGYICVAERLWFSKAVPKSKDSVS